MHPVGTLLRYVHGGRRASLWSVALCLVTCLAAQPPPQPRAAAPAATLVVIDPGHGGADNGARGTQSAIPEKRITLELAQELGSRLRSQAGIAVVLSRITDVEISAIRRSEIANSAAGSLFISLHAGTSFNPRAGGGRVYFSGEFPAAVTSSGAEHHVNAVLGNAPRKVEPQTLIPWKEAHRAFDAASNDLAAHLQRELNKLYAVDHQVQALPLYLLRCTAMPSVLVEVGYLSHEQDEQNLQSPDFRESLVERLAAGILNFLAHESRLRLGDP